MFLFMNKELLNLIGHLQIQKNVRAFFYFAATTNIEKEKLHLIRIFVCNAFVQLYLIWICAGSSLTVAQCSHQPSDFPIVR